MATKARLEHKRISPLKHPDVRPNVRKDPESARNNYHYSQEQEEKITIANNYLQFSEVIKHLTWDEETWLKQQLKDIYVFEGEEYTDDELPEGLNLDDARWSGVRALRDLETDDPEWMGFEYEFCDAAEWHRWGRHLWLYAEECGEPEHVAHLVQMFLRRFRPDQCWSLTYAFTCTSPKVGEFSGGGCFVTAEEILWRDADAYIANQREAFAKKPKTTPNAASLHNAPTLWDIFGDDAQAAEGNQGGYATERHRAVRQWRECLNETLRQCPSEQ